MARGVLGDLYFAEGEYSHEMRGHLHNAQARPTWRYYWQMGRKRDRHGSGREAVRSGTKAGTPLDGIAMSASQALGWAFTHISVRHSARCGSRR